MPIAIKVCTPVPRSPQAHSRTEMHYRDTLKHGLQPTDTALRKRALVDLLAGRDRHKQTTQLARSGGTYARVVLIQADTLAQCVYVWAAGQHLHPGHAHDSWQSDPRHIPAPLGRHKRVQAETGWGYHYRQNKHGRVRYGIEY